jgi:protein TonB
MPKAEAIPYNPGRPNWLLRGFMVISLGIHVYILGHMAGLYRSDAIRYIELEMQAERSAPERTIPAIPRREKSRPAPDTAKTMAPIPAVTPAPVAAPSAVEPIEAPQRPEVADSKLLAWVPPTSTSDIATTPAFVARNASEDYFGMVRRVIESRKKYPYTARKRQLQGRVVVQFAIETDGRVKNVALKKGSGYGILDQAALTAVRQSSPFPRPPARLFRSPVSLEICIVFELM